MSVATTDNAGEALGLWYWANAYKVSLSLFALHEVGVLKLLADGAHTGATLARELGLSEQALEPLLHLLTIMKILGKQGDSYFMSSADAKLLPLLAHERGMHIRRIREDVLVDILRGEKGIDPMVGEQAGEIWPSYLAAMAINARALAPHLVRFGNLRGRRNLVDMGGADGALSLVLERLIPNTSITVVDRPQLALAFRQLTQQSGKGNSLRFVGGDLRCPGDLASVLSGADGVILSNVLHLLSTDERANLLINIRRAVAARASVLIYDQFLHPEPTGDPALFMVVDWLLCGYRFDTTEVEFAGVLSSLGFGSISHLRLQGLPGALICAQTAP